MKEEKYNEIMIQLGKSYSKAKEKHPEFANNLSHAVSILTEEVGEVAKEVNDFNYEFELVTAELVIENLKGELFDVMAVCLRFIEMIDRE